MNQRERITFDPRVRSGKPCIRGTRMTVLDVLEYLGGGMSRAEVLDDFTDLAAEDIEACLVFAAEHDMGQWRRKDDDLLARINSRPDVLDGKPVIRGTRLSVEFILNLLDHGATQQEILAEYEGLIAEDIAACLLFASKLEALRAEIAVGINEAERGTSLSLPLRRSSPRDAAGGRGLLRWCQAFRRFRDRRANASRIA